MLFVDFTWFAKCISVETLMAVAKRTNDPRLGESANV